MIAGQAFVQTVRHFFPDFNRWLDALPDSREPSLCVYETRFLTWCGLFIFLGQFGSRRRLDFELETDDTHVLENLNRLANTQHTTRPVNDTVDHLLEHVPAKEFTAIRLKMVQRLIRMKALDSSRLLGHLVIAIDATGVLSWNRPHCPHCLTQVHKRGTTYMHQVLEAKLIGPAGVVLSVGSEFIDNRDLGEAEKSAEDTKQDCELKALSRVMPRLKQDFPQAAIVLSGDSLYACGRAFQLAKDNDWRYVFVLKEGRLPTVWREFETLAPLCPTQALTRVFEDGMRQEFRWVHDLSYVDDQNRRWKFDAIECMETTNDGKTTRFAWATNLPVSKKTVEEIAEKGGRHRWKIENEGFNRQKNSGLNLEHAYSIDPEKMQAYYYLLQIAFILTQLLERGSLLVQLAANIGKRVNQVFSGLANIAQRLVEGLRYRVWPESCFDAEAASRLRISFAEDSS